MSGVEPLVIFTIFVSVFTLSPGLILSGLYPQKKSLLNFSPDDFSNSLTQTSSVTPGYTVDSYTMMSFFLITVPTVLDDEIKGFKSGLLNSSTGVGTDIIKILQSLVSSMADVKFKLSLTDDITSSLISRVLS